METKKHSPAGYEPLQSHDDNTEIEDYHKDSRNFVDTKIFIESFEAEKLIRLINDKKGYLAKAENKYAKQKLQQEIILLEREILPIVLRETSLYFGEIVKIFEKSLKKAIDAKCNALLYFVPLSDGAGDIYRVGIVNPHGNLFETSKIDYIDVSIETIGLGGRKVEPLNIEL